MLNKTGKFSIPAVISEELEDESGALQQYLARRWEDGRQYVIHAVTVTESEELANGLPQRYIHFEVLLKDPADAEVGEFVHRNSLPPGAVPLDSERTIFLLESSKIFIYHPIGWKRVR